MNSSQLINELDALRKKCLALGIFSLFFWTWGTLLFLAPEFFRAAFSEIQSSPLGSVLRLLGIESLQSIPTWGLPAILGLGLVLGIACGVAVKRYKDQFKREFVPRELTRWIPNLKYRRDSDLTAESFRKIGVCPPHFNRYEAEDSLYLESPELDYRFDEVRAVLVKSSGKHSSTQVLFQGHLLTVDLPQIPASLKLRIEPDLRDALLAHVPQGLRKTLSQSFFFKEDQDTVRFDNDPEFEKHHRVVCSDEAFTRGLITQELREKFNRHKQTSPKHPIALSILDQKLYLAFSRSKNSLEPPWLRSIHENNTVLSFVTELKEEVEWLRFVLSILA